VLNLNTTDQLFDIGVEGGAARRRKVNAANPTKTDSNV